MTNPPDAQLRVDGPWLRMAAAYERCADDEISRRYGEVIRAIREIDPRHLVSARSASQPSWTSWFAYDLRATGKHFDFSSPEGYGLEPEEAGFTVAYAHYAGNGKPVYWAEFGLSIYPYDTTGLQARLQGDMHRGFSRMLLASAANGLASWWNVGGYRVDEKSDFGVFSPDGAPRPAARELRDYAARATAPRAIKSPSTWVTIDRDRHAAAYQAVYDENKAAYVKAVRAGGTLGVRTAGTGADSADCPLTCVGDLPYDGFSPLKFLNAEFNRIEIQDANGIWQEVADGGHIPVARDRPVFARIALGNTGDAGWLARAGEGQVRVIGDDRPDANSSAVPRLAFAAPIPRDTPRYADVEIARFAISSGLGSPAEVVFTLDAAGRARFGPRWRVRLEPRP